jgi:UDP-GlcNAc:undecaprenyl-phosphate GlcNAc-1-phosphate transferase
MNVGIYLVVFTGVLMLAVIGTPLARKVGLRIAMDQPDPTRKVHTVPTPRLGGVAIFLSTLIVTVRWEDSTISTN